MGATPAGPRDPEVDTGKRVAKRSSPPQLPVIGKTEYFRGKPVFVQDHGDGIGSHSWTSKEGSGREGQKPDPNEQASTSKPDPKPTTKPPKPKGGK